MDDELELFRAVRFDPGFAARAESIATRSWRRRAASESAGRAGDPGLGDELVGARAYRPGDDPRTIDWTASARSEQPIVRLLRRARGGTEVIALDASLSMAIGPPGKLQRAAEIAATLALYAARGGALVTLLAPPSKLRFVLDSPARFRGLLAALESLEASGRLDWSTPRFPRCDGATWIGDLAGVRPDELARTAPRGCALRVVHVLAPHEIAPDLPEPATLVDPESGERLAVDAASIADHALRSERRHAAFVAELARRRARLVRASSAESFEVACARLLGA